MDNKIIALGLIGLSLNAGIHAAALPQVPNIAGGVRPIIPAAPAVAPVAFPRPAVPVFAPVAAPVAPRPVVLPPVAPPANILPFSLGATKAIGMILCPSYFAVSLFLVMLLLILVLLGNQILTASAGGGLVINLPTPPSVSGSSEFIEFY